VTSRGCRSRSRRDPTRSTICRCPLSAIAIDWLPVLGARILADVWMHAS
jgi:hypothetical protein